MQKKQSVQNKRKLSSEWHDTVVSYAKKLTNTERIKKICDEQYLVRTNKWLKAWLGVRLSAVDIKSAAVWSS